MPRASLLFIKSDVEELYQYMSSVLLNSLTFEKVKNNHLNYLETYNPSKIKTEREKYSILKNLTIYDAIYKKIN